MKKLNQPIELIVQLPAAQSQRKDPSAMKSKLKKAGIDGDIFTQPQSKAFKKIAGALPKKRKIENTIIKTTARDTEINPWDMAHLTAKSLGSDAVYIEPEFANEFVVYEKIAGDAGSLNVAAFAKSIPDNNYDADWLPHENKVWHLDDEHSQLNSARQAVADIDYVIRIGHLDTGYSKTHTAIQDAVRNNPLQRNFVKGELANDAHDPASNGFLKMPWHGTGTGALLAGGKVNLKTSDGVFNDFLGAAYFAEIVSCRIAESVILIKTNAFSDALNYLTELSLSGTPVHVVSMSMGGAPSKIWADAVNAAYEAGITIVTPTGNNYAGLPTRHVIYPARFGRVIAACGATYDHMPYRTDKLTEMQGCYGPKKHMTKALAAYTPNTPWATGETNRISFSGAGTSSATPQIAAAATIYYRKYHAELDKLQPWERVEAIRNALYRSATKKVGDPKYDKDFITYYGNGILKANDALKIPVAASGNYKKTTADTVPWFPILNTIFKAVPNAKERTTREMLNTELAQLVYSYPELSALIDDDKRDYEKVSAAKWKRFKEAVIAHPAASVTLKKYLQNSPAGI